MLKTSVFVKAAAIAMAVALGFSSIAFAKGGVAKAPVVKTTQTPPSAQVLQSTWQTDLNVLKFDNFVLGRLDKVFEFVVTRFGKVDQSKRPDHRFAGRLEITLKEVETLLSKAQAIVTAHAGFDASGKVTDAAQAQKTVQALSADLAQLRGTLIYRLEHLIKA